MAGKLTEHSRKPIENHEEIPTADTVVSPWSPTLHDAFTVLCQAMAAHLDDNMDAHMHAEEIQGWYANGPANYAMAWKHAILLLEQVLGIELMHR